MASGWCADSVSRTDRYGVAFASIAIYRECEPAGMLQDLGRYVLHPVGVHAGRGRLSNEVGLFSARAIRTSLEFDLELLRGRRQF